MILGQLSHPNLEEPELFYDNTEVLRFSKRDHTYYRVGEGDELEIIDGVTRTCGIIDKSQYLMPWACKVMAERIIETMPIHKRLEFLIAPMTVKAFLLHVNTAKKTHADLKMNAADFGTQAHEWLENVINTAIAKNHGIVTPAHGVPNFEDERANSCVRAALDWMGRHMVKWHEAECKVYSREHRYAGTMDGIAQVNSCTDKACCPKKFRNQLSLIDWKSSNALRVEYLYQTAAYQQAYQEEFNVRIDARWILRLGKEDGAFEAWYETEFEQDLRGFLACLNLVRTHRAVEKRVHEKE